MALDPKKVFVLPKSSRTDAQRSASEAGAATTDKDDKITAKQFLALNKSVLAINKNLNAIANLIKEKAQADADSDRDDNDRRRRDADAKKKGAAEKMLEGVLSNAVVKPLKTIQKTTSNIFDTLFKALATLFAGYVGIKGVDGIKDWLEGDRSTLKNLGKEVALVLTAAAGVFTAITVGIPLITSGIGGVIGAVLGGLPSAFALLGNPYVWMGVIAATGAVLIGTELYKYLSGEYGSPGGGFSGRGSYHKDRKVWIDRVYEVGQEGAINEMDQKVAAIAKKYPMLFEDDGVTPKGDWARKNYSGGGVVDANNALQDIINAKKYIKMGKWDRFDIAKLSKSDQEAMHAIMQHVTKAKSAWELFKLKQNELTILMEGKSYYELSEGLQTIVDGVLKQQADCKSQIVSALEAGNELEGKMSSNGQDFINGIAEANGFVRLFAGKNMDYDSYLKLGPIRDKKHKTDDQINPGMYPSKIKHFDKLIGIEKAYRRVIPAGLERAGFKPPEVSKVSTNNTLKASNNNDDNSIIKQNDISESSNIFTNKNLNTAQLFNGSSYLNDQEFNFVPIDLSESSNVGSEVFNAQGYNPAIFEYATNNLLHDDYISLFESQIGVYSDE